MTTDSIGPTSVDPIEFATSLIASAAMTAVDVIEARRTDPGAFPTFGPTPNDWSDVGRRALGLLINHGWTHPLLSSPTTNETRETA